MWPLRHVLAAIADSRNRCDHGLEKRIASAAGKACWRFLAPTRDWLKVYALSDGDAIAPAIEPDSDEALDAEFLAALEADDGHSLGSLHAPRNTSNTFSHTDAHSEDSENVDTDSDTDENSDDSDLDADIYYECERGQDYVDVDTGELLPSSTYCNRSRCAVCAERQCKRLARIAAWSLEDAPYVYLLTLTPVERETWQERRKAMLREARVAGRRVEMLSVVEQELQTHVHAVLWTSHPLKLTNSVDNTLKKVGSSYVDRYNAAYYLTKTVHRDNNLSQHLELNKRHLASWTGGFFYGYSGFKDARRGYVEEKAWLKS